jgi:hypothetical protein
VEHTASGSVSVGDVKLNRCRTFAVSVTASGAPVAGASVYFEFPTGGGTGGDLEWIHFDTDASGEARLRDPFGWIGTQTILIEAERFASETVELPREGRASVRVELTLPVSIRGVVLDPYGQGAPGVRVEATTLGGVDSFPARTDAEGRFELGSLHGGRTFQVRTRTEDRELLDDTRRSIAPARDVTLRLELRHSVHLRVPADDPADRPNTTLTLQGRAEDGSWHKVPDSIPRVDEVLDDQTDVVGTFPGLRSGTYRIVAVRAGSALSISEPFLVAAPVTRVDLHFDPGRHVRGRLLDDSGLARFALRLGGDEIELPETPDEGGAFELAELPEGDVELVVKTFGGKETLLRVAAGQADVGDLRGP